MAAEFRAMQRETRASTEQILQNTAQMREHGESIRAMPDVILRFLDRLDEPGGAAAAT